MVLGPGSSGPCHARRNAATRHSRPMTWGRQQVGPTAAVRLAATLPFPASCPARCRPRPSCRPPSLHPSSHCLRGSEAWDVGDARCERSQGTRWFLGRDVYKSLCHLALRGMRGWGQTWPCGSRSLGGREGPGSQGSGGGGPPASGCPASPALSPGVSRCKGTLVPGHRGSRRSVHCLLNLGGVASAAAGFPSNG